MPNQKSATAFSRFSSLRVRVLLFIAVLIFPLLLVLLYFSNAYRNIIIQELRGDALQLTRSIADVQEHHINGSRQFLLLLSQLPIIREQNWEACNTFYLEIFPAYRETYTNIGYIDVEGNLKCSVLLPEDSVNLSDQSWYQKVRDTREFAIGNYLISVLNNKLVVPLGMPVFSYDGEWIGVVGVALSLEWLNDLIAETPLPEYGVLTITDVNGIILARQAHREERGRLRGVGEQLRDMHVFEEIKQLGEGTIERELRGEQQFVGFSSIGEGDSRLHIILTVPQEIVFAPSAELEKISFLFLGVVMVLSLLIGVLGSQVLIVSAVDRLVAATIKLTQGDLSTRVENISGISEFQILANNFNHMVSALQERDAALRRSERKFRDIFDHAFQFMALLTPDGRIVEINLPSVTFNRASYEQLVGQHFSELPGWSQGGEGVKLRLWNAVACAAQGEFIRHEEQAYAADDHFANIDLSFKPMYDDHGKVNLILVEGRDITEVKTVKTALQQAEKANQLKLKFLAMISHELRTPLTSIKGFATTLLATDVQWDMESVQQFISIINVEADRLTDLVEQLLDLSRLEAGTLSINKQLTTFKTVLDTALPQINILTERHQYITDIQPHLPPMIVDVQRISQVITNLISNAVKYSPVNSVICLKAYEEKDALRIEVEDQGVGIPSSERDIVFQAFRRAGREDASNVNGAGLGLSICRGLVEAHGGQIWIEDKENPGIRICFTIPYSAEDITRRQWPDS